MVDDIKIVRSNRRSIAIVILPDGTVEVRAPKFIPQFAIKAFANSKSDWIEERREFVKKNVKTSKKFEDGEKFVFLGKEYSLQVGHYADIEIKEGKLLSPHALLSQGRLILEKWYIRQAKETIKSQVDYYSKAMNLSFNGVSFSDTRSKWGSCTHDNRLQFNWRLIMAPLLVVRYVVIHELVHTEVKNHSRIFWSKVRLVNPSYKQQIKWLKLHGDKLKF